MEEKLEEVFNTTLKGIKGFEARSCQQEMAGQIVQAYLKSQIALVEAGTGTGKSLAYLIPAILWAIKTKERTVISTHTIALQEQLLLKDIPLLLKVLNVDLKAVIVKGMGNYLCLKRLEEVSDLDLPSDLPLDRIKDWSEKTKEGSYSSLPFFLPVANWEKVNADSHSCSHIHCPHYKECFVFRARRHAEDAHLIVANHHMLLADLAARERSQGKEEKSLIPSYSRVVVDEAHHLEDVALSALSCKFDRLWLVRLLGRLHSETHPERGRFYMIREMIKEPQSSLIPRLLIDLPASKNGLVELIAQAFAVLEAFCQKTFGEKEARWRLRQEHLEHPLLLQEVIPQFQQLVKALEKFIQSLQSLKTDIDQISMDQSTIVQGIAAKLDEYRLGLEKFFENDDQLTRVRWVEVNTSGSNLTLVDARLDVSQFLREKFFSTVATASLCSATLSCAGGFKHLRQALGINEEFAVTENIYHSPFDYATQSLLAIPTDLPDPAESTFIQNAIATIEQALEISQGGAFILFTSYEMLHMVHQALHPFALEKGLLFLKQGDGSRQMLVEQFKKEKRCVLFGTDSFWEGIDIAGNALRLVIITKLPFRVPSDPLVQAVSELLDKSGKNAFMDYQVPQAVLKFKQGFGRLIRTKEDKGAILCLDKRLSTKFYGKLFIKSLPECKIVTGTSNEVLEAMKAIVSL